MKRALPCLIALALCLTFLPTSTFAATVLDSGTCGGNLTWAQYDDGTTVISGSGAMTDYQTATMTPWISNRITKLVVSSGVTRIGNHAFEDTPPLKSVWIGDTVKQIGTYAFASCPQLTKVTLYASVTDIEYGAFYECDKLTDVYYYGTPEQWAAINLGYANGPLHSVTVHYVDASEPVTLESIAVETLPDKTTYGKNESLDITGLTLMANYSNGTSQEITSGFTVAGFDSKTAGVKTLTVTYQGFTANFEVTVWQPATSGTFDTYLSWNLDEQGTLTISGTGGMYGYSSATQPWLSHLEAITTVVIESGVTSIGRNAFENCINLKSITISDTVTYIGSFAFAGCTGLEEINYNATQISTLGRSNYSFSRAGAAGNGITVNIGANVKYIPAYLFGNVNDESKIIAVNFAEGSVCTSIGSSAFYGCNNLTSITIPDSVTSIGDYAFYFCRLTSVTIPEGVTSIGNYAFEYCWFLEEINFNATAMNDLSSSNGVFSHAGQSGNGITVNIGANVTKIPAYLFYPSSVDSYDAKITAVNFAKGSACTSIGRYAFCGCAGLTSITIPDSMVDIGDYAFYGCTGLTDVYYGGTQERWNAITIASGNASLTAATLHVVESELTGIAIKTQPTKTEYVVGEKLDTTGLVLTVTYNDGSTADITEGFTVTGFDSTTAGPKTVTVTYKDFSETFTVAVYVDQNAPQIVLESKKVTKGSEFAVTVKIKNNPGFSYLEVTPSYSSALTLVNVENGELISDFTKGKQYVWVSDEDVTTDGLLMTFTFSVADTVEPGTYQAGFQLRTCGNYNEEAVTLNVVAADIEVIDYVYGDATGDGKVDGFDVIRLKKFLAEYDYDTDSSTVEIAPGADANGDGKVDGFDVIRLKKYLADYDYETGQSSVVLGPQ